MEAVPYITFLYLFQPNVPSTYDELRETTTDLNRTWTNQNRSLNQIEEEEKEKNDDWRYLMIDKVLYRASLLAVFIYAFVGIFGYITFSLTEKQTFDQL